MNDVRPPVQPMNDLAWARVERGLWARLDGTQPAIEPVRSRRWLWIALPAVGVAAAVAAAFAVFVDTPALPAAPPAPAVASHQEVPLRVASGSAPSTITHGDAHVALDADSAVVLAQDTSSAVLERGAAWFAIAPRQGRQFVVIAGDAFVRAPVAGTRFRVARFEEHATIEVERGTIDITFQGTTVKLGAGQTWTSQHTIQQPASVETAKPVKRAPKQAALVDDERSRYEHAAALETRDPAAALAGYLELARGTSRWSEISLYAAARLAADRREPRAKILLDAYLRRFPRGANADDARQLLDRLKGAP